MKPKYDLLPEYMQEGMKLWIEEGVAPGSFLTALLCNDFMGAARNADDTNIHRLKDYAVFLYNYAPSDCFGSPDNVRAWADRGGLFGGERAARSK